MSLCVMNILPHHIIENTSIFSLLLIQNMNKNSHCSNIWRPAAPLLLQVFLLVRSKNHLWLRHNLDPLSPACWVIPCSIRWGYCARTMRDTWLSEASTLIKRRRHDGQRVPPETRVVWYTHSRNYNIVSNNNFLLCKKQQPIIGIYETK